MLPVTDRSLLHDSTETRGLTGEALGAVFPGSTAEVAAVVRWCARTGVPFVPRGGGTGYAGGAVPDAGSLVIALQRMTAVREAVPQAWRMTVEAGLTTRGLQRAAAGEGLWFAPNPGAAEQSQIGGNIATNAGGPRSLRHGTVRAFVSGIELVLATGEVLRAGGAARKNVESLDLVGLACGSEGTLGVITAAWLRLLPRPEVILPVVALYPDRAAGLAALEAAMACGCVPTSLEFVDARAFSAAAATYPRPLAITGAFAVLAEAGGPAAVARVERDMLVEALTPGAAAVDAPDSAGRGACARVVARRGVAGGRGRARWEGVRGLRGAVRPARRGARDGRADRAPSTVSTWPAGATPATATCTRRSWSTAPIRSPWPGPRPRRPRSSPSPSRSPARSRASTASAGSSSRRRPASRRSCCGPSARSRHALDPAGIANPGRKLPPEGRDG